jgi:hypothetical protein
MSVWVYECMRVQKIHLARTRDARPSVAGVVEVIRLEVAVRGPLFFEQLGAHAVGVQWECSGSAVGVQWECSGRAVGVQCECSGSAVGVQCA